jgi:hypothetical protein
MLSAITEIQNQDHLVAGWEVKQYHHFFDGGNGVNANGIVIANDPTNFHPWAVWTAYKSDSDGRWHCESGDYYMKEEEARERFEQRKERGY